MHLHLFNGTTHNLDNLLVANIQTDGFSVRRDSDCSELGLDSTNDVRVRKQRLSPELGNRRVVLVIKGIIVECPVRDDIRCMAQWDGSPDATQQPGRATSDASATKHAAVTGLDSNTADRQ